MFSIFSLNTMTKSNMSSLLFSFYFTPINAQAPQSRGIGGSVLLLCSTKINKACFIMLTHIRITLHKLENTHCILKESRKYTNQNCNKFTAMVHHGSCRCVPIHRDPRTRYIEPKIFAGQYNEPPHFSQSNELSDWTLPSFQFQLLKIHAFRFAQQLQTFPFSAQ
jgi:hypothetical protein